MFAVVFRQRKSTLAMALVLFIVAVVAMRHIERGEFDFNVDESQHACTGQFVASFIRDHPILHPIQYTYLYYAHYPALSGVIHWPPFFYIYEGVIFALFGASVVTARLAVLTMSLLGLAFWFRLVERLHSTTAAVAATLLLGFTPVVVLYNKVVMMEMPSLALAIIASYLWILFLQEQRNEYLYWFSFSAALAVLTKQNCVYLPLFCLLSLLALGAWRLLLRRATLLALAIGVVMAGPYYLLVYLTHWKTIAGDALEKQPSFMGSVTFYIKAIPELTGWPILLLALVGIITCFFWAPRKNVLIFGSWMMAVYLTMTLIGHKEARYVICLVPALLYFALWPLLWSAVPKKVFGAALACMVAYLAWSAWLYDRPYIAGYAPVARAISQRADSGIILLDADVPANFIFFMREQDPQGRFVVLRKAMYSFRIKSSLGYEVYMHTSSDLEALFRDDGIRYIVVSNRPPENFPICRILRDFLQTKDFRLIGQYPVESNTGGWKNYSLLVYENLHVVQPESATLHIPMLTLSHGIDISFSELGVTFPSPGPKAVKQ